MHAALLFPNDYLCAADLHERDVPLTISRLVQEELRTDKGDETKWVIYFLEMEERHKKDKKKLNKKLVLNKTNAKLISKTLGTETTAWVGKKITVYPTTCQSFGETVDCIRVRAPKDKRSSSSTSKSEPAPDSAPPSNPGGEEWSDPGPPPTEPGADG